MIRNRRNLVWKTSRREFDLSRAPLLMAVINVTPDSFSDGGHFADLETAIAEAEKALEAGADIIDVGGESSRPGASKISVEEELARVIPVVEDLAKRFDAAISVDTTKAEVAAKALEAGAEIINDISGFRFEPAVARVVADKAAAVVLMHSRGDFEEMHSLAPADDVFEDLFGGFERSLEVADQARIGRERICLDVGIGFGKTLEQNLELIRNLDRVIARYPDFPMLIGVSRKSFIGRILREASPDKRLYGTLAANAAAVLSGADIIRVHDVRAHKDLLEVLNAINV
jgi:dihydropteroate synthase